MESQFSHKAVAIEGGILALGGTRVFSAVGRLARRAGLAFGCWAQEPNEAERIVREKKVALVLVDGSRAEKQYWAPWALERGKSVLYCGWNGWDFTAQESAGLKQGAAVVYQLEALLLAQACPRYKRALTECGPAIFVETRIQLPVDDLAPDEGVDAVFAPSWLLAMLYFFGPLDKMRAQARSLRRNRAGADWLTIQSTFLNGIESTATIHALGPKRLANMELYGLRGHVNIRLPFATPWEEAVLNGLEIVLAQQKMNTQTVEPHQGLQQVLAWMTGLRQAIRTAKEVGGHELRQIT